ncbi:MAG: ethanolamine ammonia-lyase subunit EutB [Actinobacteria bacterium]|nr:ethanolamine ammonia-lyase subunit EutB [Actinomycetota bacterium]MCB9411835.1 ethanolamine ammonia-lyase subunit EutB [Actinomycetota bacterium]
MPYRVTYRGQSYTFADLATLLAKASPFRSGDVLAGIAADSAVERAVAQSVLADVALTDFIEHPLIAPESDEVSRYLLESHRPEAFATVAHLTVGGLRDHLLDEATGSVELSALAWGLTPEMVAAVSKLMRNQDLIAVARKCHVVTSFRNTLGLPGHFATRIQPNHPTDDPRGILASTVDGLSLGAGDAVIGVNPAGDGPEPVIAVSHLLAELIERYRIPTQSCVLAHVRHTLTAIEAGAPVDLVFQSIGGSEALNRGFGIDIALLDEAYAAGLSLERGTVGQNVMYFETGQGSALSAGAHHGIDQQTMEARTYGLARRYEPLLVNSVVGFIGPEYLYDGKQIIRAGLEDHFCGKLLGLPMGVDVCHTNHAEADSDDMDTLLTLLGVAGVNYVMGVPGTDDVMLGYQSTSFHDAVYLREVLDLRPAPEFEVWLESMGVMQGGRLTPDSSQPLLEGHRELAP